MNSLEALAAVRCMPNAECGGLSRRLVQVNILMKVLESSTPMLDDRTNEQTAMERVMLELELARYLAGSLSFDCLAVASMVASGCWLWHWL